jgi:hypothetical protein
LVDDTHFLRVYLQGEPDGPTLVVAFDRIAYRVSDESDRLSTMDSLAGKALTPLCVVANSTWLPTFVRDGYEMRANQSLKHFAIITSDEVVDVIALDDPTVSVLASEVR